MSNVQGLRTRKLEMQEREKQIAINSFPLNQYMNTMVDGKPKYKYSEKMRKYFLELPDSILDDLRNLYAYLQKTKSQLQNIERWKKQIADNNFCEKNKDGMIMLKDELESNILAEKINISRNCADIRNLLLTHLVGKCDDKVFTLEMFESHVERIESELGKLGLKLFPEDFNVID